MTRPPLTDFADCEPTCTREDEALAAIGADRDINPENTPAAPARST